MDQAVAILIVRLVELALVYGTQAVSNIVLLWPSDKDITVADLDTLEAQLKHPSDYMPRPEDAPNGTV